MARFDLYPNPGPLADRVPYLLDVQSDLLDELESRMVIPLRRLDQIAQVKLPTRLMPVVKVNGADYFLETPKMAAVPKRILKQPVMSLSAEQHLITGALDFLFNGY